MDDNTNLDKLTKKFIYELVGFNITNNGGFDIYPVGKFSYPFFYNQDPNSGVYNLLSDNIKRSGNNFEIVSRTYEEFKVNIVTSGEKFGAYLDQIIDNINKNKIIIINGPKGIGKSILTYYSISKLLEKDEYIAITKINTLVSTEDVHYLLNFLETYKNEYNKLNKKILILYDPSPLEAYLKFDTININLHAANKTVKELIKLLDKLNEYEISVTMVLPEDLYNILDENIKNTLESYVKNIDLKDEKFLEDIIKAYAGRNINKRISDEIIKKINEFNEGYTLLARFIGEKLRIIPHIIKRRDARDILLEDAIEDALKLMVDYINQILEIYKNDSWDPKKIKSYLSLLEKRYKEMIKSNDLKPGDYIISPESLSKLCSKKKISCNPEAIKWLAQKHEDLTEITILFIMIINHLASNMRKKAK